MSSVYRCKDHSWIVWNPFSSGVCLRLHSNILMTASNHKSFSSAYKPDVLFLHFKLLCLFYVYFFLQLTIQECSCNISLMKLEFMFSCWPYQSLNWFRSYHWTKCFTKALIITLGNQPCFLSFNVSISIMI